MALKDRFRRVASRKNSSTSSSPSSASPSSSGSTTPSTQSRTPSTTQLPTLPPSPTSTSLKLAKTTTSFTLTKTSSTISRLSLSRFRSGSSSSSSSNSNSSKKENWAKYAPPNYRFGAANPEKVATLNAWEWSFGANARASISSGISPSRNTSLDIPRAQHVEDVAVKA